MDTSRCFHWIPVDLHDYQYLSWTDCKIRLYSGHGNNVPLPHPRIPKMTFWGKHFDSETISIAESTITENTCESEEKEITNNKSKIIMYCWLQSSSTLFFIAHQIFVYNWVQEESSFYLNQKARKDILWFLTYMDIFDHKTTIPDHEWCETDKILATYAKLGGLGGICHKESVTQVFHCYIPHHNSTLSWKLLIFM